MKTAKDLMLAYINGSAEQSGALFATNGTLRCDREKIVGGVPRRLPGYLR
jgi:hypothetical protein